MRAAAMQWAHRFVQPTGPAELVHQRPWADVWRLPVQGGRVWFKQCAAVQAFEPRLTAGIAARSPDVAPEVLAYENSRRWLLLADAGTAVRQLGNAPEIWLDALPRYAELQRREIPHAPEHLAAGVPDMRAHLITDSYRDALRADLPLTATERLTLERFEPTLARWCAELGSRGIPATVQHDDLHHNNVFRQDGRCRILDWGDSVISHPFASLLVTFQFLQEINRLARTDGWFARLRDAYLEPWGPGHVDTFRLAMRVGAFAHAVAWLRQRRALPAIWMPRFDSAYRPVLQHALDLARGERAAQTCY